MMRRWKALTDLDDRAADWVASLGVGRPDGENRVSVLGTRYVGALPEPHVNFEVRLCCSHIVCIVPQAPKPHTMGRGVRGAAVECVAQ